MVRACMVLLALLFVAGATSPPSVWAQDPRGPPFEQTTTSVYLGQNYPNPVREETWIPFYLEEEVFEDGDTVVVTVRIVNLLRQLVAIPVIEDHPSGRVVPVLELPFMEPGRTVAYWDGKDTAGRRVRSGMYYCELVVNGQPSSPRKIIVPRRRPSLLPWFMR